MKSKTILFLVTIKIILAIAIVSADVITPGFHGISVSNNITNIKDFPDYVFVSGGGIGPGMCPMKIIDDGGIIENYYKFCSVFVYAIPKDKFDVNIIDEINNGESITNEEAENLLKGISGIKVLENIHTYEEVADISPIKEKMNEYVIDINQLKSSPNNVKTLKKGLAYRYILVSIIALSIIVWIIIKKKRRK